MRPDGFGGMAVLITAEAVMKKSTGDIIADFLNKAVPGWAGEPTREAADIHSWKTAWRSDPALGVISIE